MSGQAGWKTESVWGTPVVVDTFVPILGFTPTINEGHMRPAGIRASRNLEVPMSLGARSVGGNLRMELPNVSLASLLKAIHGSVVTTGAGPYTHTYGWGATPSQTIQVGIEDSTGTVRAFTFEGCKHHQFELSCQVGQFAMLSTDFTAQDVVTGTALATASYASGLTPFTFVHASVSVNGSAVTSARAVTLRGDKRLRTDRHVLASRLPLEQLREGRFSLTGSLTADFDSLSLFALQAAGTSVALSLVFSNGSDSLTYTGTIQIVGDPPPLSSNGLEEQTINFEVGHSSSDATALTPVLVNTEASAA